MSPASARPLIAVLIAVLVVRCWAGEDGTAPVTRPTERMVVPDLAGMNPVEAWTKLCAAGLSVGAVKVVARTPEVGPRAGDVVAAAAIRASRPVAGEAVARSQSIELDIDVPRNAVVALRTSC